MKKLLLALVAVLCTVGSAWAASVNFQNVTNDFGRLSVMQNKTTTFQVGGFTTGDITISLNGSSAFSTNRTVIKAFWGSISWTDVDVYFKPVEVGAFSTVLTGSCKSSSNTITFNGQGIVNFTAAPLVYNGVRVQVPGIAMSEEHLNAPVSGTSMTVRDMVGGYKATVSGNGVNVELTAVDFAETLTSAPLQPGNYTVKVELIPSEAGAAEWDKFAPYYDAVSANLTVAAPALGCKFDTQGQLSTEPVLFADPVDAPADYAGNTAKWPVKFEAANQFIYRFKPQMTTQPGSEEATDLSYAYYIDGQLLSDDMYIYDPATDSVTLQRLPLDLTSNSSLPMTLRVVASYSVDNVAYTAEQSFDIPAANLTLPHMFQPELQTVKAVKTGGYYQGQTYDVYSLNLAFHNVPTVNTPYYYMGGFNCELAADFHATTPPDGFADNNYGVVGKDFDRTPRMAYNGDSQVGLPGYEYYNGTWASNNNWARLMATTEQIGMILPHFMMQPAGGQEPVAHGAARVSFNTYYPVVTDGRYTGQEGMQVGVMQAPANALDYTIQSGAVQPDDVITGVADVTVNTDPEAVYNLQGIRVGTTDKLHTLPAGLYIVGGRKLMMGN